MLCQGTISCATYMHHDPFYLDLDHNMEQLSGYSAERNSDAVCEIAREKKIVYLLFALPTTEINPREIQEFQSKYSIIRYRDVATPGDIALSAVGFLVGIIFRTKIVEGCNPQIAGNIPALTHPPVQSRASAISVPLISRGFVLSMFEGGSLEFLKRNHGQGGIWSVLRTQF